MSTTPTDFGATLTAAVQGGYVAHLTGQTYTITSPIVIHITSTIQGALGIDGGGATLVSRVTNGSPLIEIIVDPGVDVRYLTLSNFKIEGNGKEGDGIKILADGNDRWLYNWNITNVTVEHVGGYGLDVQGSVFEGMVSNSWMNGNAQGGAYFAHSSGGGVASALRWYGGGLQNNGGAGLTLDNGTRDMSVDHASFVSNNGPGISALWGITSVTASDFQDNQGAGVVVWNYGNFTGDTFSTSGSQTVGISGYLAGGATLLGNTSTYSGTGSDSTVLADVQGHGELLQTGNSGQVVTGADVVASGAAGAGLPVVSVGTQGVAMPTLAPVTAATTAATADSTGTGALETALSAALAGSSVIHLTDDTYIVTAPIVINVTRSTQGPVGIDLGGAKIISQITDGSPVIEIIVGRGVDLGSLTLSNFSILGNGQEGDGIKIVADGNDRLVHNWNISHVNVEHVGGIGLDVLGNVSQGTIFNSWMHGNDQGGARFANSAGGGVASALEWVGGGFRKNDVAGLILDSGAHDMSVKGAYFVENNGPGLDATSGITLVRESGFENNQGAGAVVQNFANFTNDTFATWGTQATAIGGYLTGGQVTLIGVGKEYYGAGPDPTVLANFQGNGTLAIAGGGNVWVGPNVAVSAADPVVTPPASAPAVTERLVNDSGASSTDKITSDPTLTGTADPNAVVHFTVDGSAIAATATANSSGAWSLTLTGLADGQHTIVASETNAAGSTGTASLTFTLDTHSPIPVFTGGVLANGQVTLTGTTGEANDTISLYDGDTWVGFATTGSDGSWSFTASAASNVAHSYGANATDLAGNEGHGSSPLILSGSDANIALPSLTARLLNDTGASSTDKITSDPTLTGTADPNAVVHFAVDGTAIAATATANSSGTWSFIPTGLGDGTHTVVASETNAAGSTEAASLTFTLDTHPALDAHLPIPAFTGAVLDNGQVTLTGTTGEADDTISLYDGNTWVGFATTGNDGSWSFIASAPSTVVHSYGANATDPSGREGHGSNRLILGSADADTLAGGSGNDVIIGNGGNDRIAGGAGADTLTGGSGQVTFAYNAVADSTASASDTIIDFRHGADNIDFTNIAGINATSGVPTFQGNITGAGNLTLNAHSVAYLEAGGNTRVLVNTTNHAEAVTTADTHAADMEIVLVGVHLGLTATDFF